MMMKIINDLKTNYNQRTILFASLNIIISFMFAFYNGVIGYVHQSLWYGCICIYYILLILIRIILIIGNKTKQEKLLISFTYLLLLIFTISMITPINIMISDKRVYDLGLIPAIGMAAFTTYSITMSITNVIKTRKMENIFIKLIRLINLISCLMSILVLQNTLIIANGGYDDKMKILTIITSLLTIMFILVMIISSYLRYTHNGKLSKR